MRRAVPPIGGADMTLHAWSEHVVHVELLSDDSEICRTAARFLEQRFRDSEPEVSSAPGQLRVHTDAARPVRAAQVATALAEAGVRATTVHEREEWSVVEL